MIDIHCHILPDVDDGPGSVKESLAMAEIARKDGIHTIVATPHTLDGVYRNTFPDIIARVASLQKVFYENRMDIRLFAGADVHLCTRLMERVNSGEAGTINGENKHLLLELPSQSIPEGVRDEIFSLKLNGITPIITHPERNAVIQRDPGILYELISMGALAQVTAMSLTGNFGPRPLRCAGKFLEMGMAHLVASDAHSTVHRIPGLERAYGIVQRKLGQAEAEEVFINRPAKILSGEAVDVPEVRTRGRVGFLKRLGAWRGAMKTQGRS